jgi:hypothetical protein
MSSRILRLPLVCVLTALASSALFADSITTKGSINLLTGQVTISLQDGGVQVGVITPPLGDLFNPLLTAANGQDVGQTVSNWIGNSQLYANWTNANGTFTGGGEIDVADFSTGITDFINGDYSGATTAFGNGTVDFNWTFTNLDVLGTQNQFSLGFNSSTGFSLDYGLSDASGNTLLDYTVFNYYGGSSGSYTLQPEPRSTWLLGSGVLALAVLAGWRRRLHR